MRILIADDHEVIRSSVIRVLQSRAGVIECAEATNGKDAVEKALEWKPDLVLLDIRLPVLSGFDAARQIKQHQPDLPILFFSIHDTKEISEEAKLVGDGFILKDKIVEMLPNAIDAIRARR
jgi:DNA-binding NarL/FixJ family response regulator